MHSLAFKTYTQMYALLHTVIFMMTSMYMPQILHVASAYRYLLIIMIILR